jgi:hypothetical protein
MGYPRALYTPVRHLPMEIVHRASHAEVPVYPWKEPKGRLAQTERQVRTGLCRCEAWSQSLHPSDKQITIDRSASGHDDHVCSGRL